MIVGIRKVVRNIFTGLSEASMVEILIVEDNAEFREMLKAVLQSGFPYAGISAAEGGEAALSKIRTKKPDLVFMDIRMPGKSGIVIAGEIKERHPDVVVAVLTNMDGSEYRDAAFAIGADFFLSKESVKAEDIQNLVREIIAQPSNQPINH
jgi:DNA-binding NarL/FixJ family response regulator